MLNPVSPFPLLARHLIKLLLLINVRFRVGGLHLNLDFLGSSFCPCCLSEVTATPPIPVGCNYCLWAVNISDRILNSERMPAKWTHS